MYIYTGYVLYFSTHLAPAAAPPPRLPPSKASEEHAAEAEHAWEPAGIASSTLPRTSTSSTGSHTGGRSRNTCCRSSRSFPCCRDDSWPAPLQPLLQQWRWQDCRRHGNAYTCHHSSSE